MASDGELLVLSTVTLKVCVALKGGLPLSLTRTLKLNEFPPCASLGTQPKAPVFELMIAPAGAPDRSVHVSVCAGMLLSVAVAVKASTSPSKTVRSAMAASTGATLGCGK